jgi:uncharacterized protein HemX
MAEQRKSGASGAKDSAKPKPKPKTSKSAKKAPPAPNLQERMEGLQGWMAEIEKKQERTSRVGGLAAILAILASGGALALGVMNKQDAATDDDVNELTEKVSELGSSVEKQTETQLKAINGRIAGLEQQIDNLNTRQRETEAEITALQTQVGNAAAASNAAAEKPAGEKQQP